MTKAAFRLLKIYYELVKPGIVYGNLLTTVAGFFLGAAGIISWTQLLATLVGIALVIGSACVFNNLIDRDIDDRMERTRDRALIKKEISSRHAGIFALILILAGAAILIYFVNLTAFAVAMIGFVAYVFLYTPLKRSSVHSTLVGTLAGAVPPVVGYVGASNRLDLAALLLFLILVFWQMPHFFAIGIRRRSDYAAAGLPILPVARGVSTTKKQMLWYLLGFIVVSLLLARFTGIIYLVCAIVLDGAWLVLVLRGFKRSVAEVAWARQVFLFSLVVLTGLSLAIIVDSLIK